MPGVSSRVSVSSAEQPTPQRRHVGIEPIWPALVRGVIFLISVATPIVATLLSR